MESFEPILQPVDTVLTTAGLYTPTRRFLGVAALVGGILYYYKPDSMFFDGYPRPWSWMSKPGGGGGDHPLNSVIPPTSLPWWLAALLAGAAAALFL
jgi:hypothetical protein